MSVVLHSAQSDITHSVTQAWLCSMLLQAECYMSLECHQSTKHGAAGY